MKTDNITLKRLLLPTSALVLSALLFSSCEHKELCFDSGNSTHINVVFDWRYAPDANPESMSMTLFDEEKNIDPLQYIFTGRDGGEIKVPLGLYDSLCLNSDFQDWAKLRYTDDEQSFELYTIDSDILPASGLSTRALPAADSNNSERFATTPGMAWAHNVDHIDLSQITDEKTITYYPREIVCHYTVDVLDVENINNLDGSQVDATLSGMAEGYHIGVHAATNNTVTHPFILSESKSTPNSLHAEFLTFGETPDVDVPHTLSLYLVYNDGTGHTFNFDVSDQIKKAADPTHVNIVVRGITIPKPIGHGGGLIPDVNDWETENIYIKM